MSTASTPREPPVDDVEGRVRKSEPRAKEASSEPEYTRGDALGRYVVIDLLGRGGMSIVYGAWDPELDRKVAIKVLLEGGGSSSASARTGTSSREVRLLREAQALAKLSHANVVPVFDVGMVEERVFVVMERVEGQTLAEWMKHERHTWREVLAKFIEAGKGLAAAHAAKLVHRDFKPQNVLVGRDGIVRVTDFGLARGSDDEGDTLAQPRAQAPSSNGDVTERSVLSVALTQAGSVLGTPSYMAPEQHDGAAVDVRADQYAFCVALYEALYGQLPFGGRDAAALFEAKRAQRLDTLHERAPQVPRWLRRVVLRGLEPEPDKRWPSMDVLLVRLRRDPRRTALRVGLASVLLGGALASGWAYAQAQQQRAALCSGAPVELEGVWDSPMQTQIEQAFLGTKLSYAEDTWQRVKAALDAYTTEWADVHRNACEATHVRGSQSQQILDLRMSCLDARFRDLRAVADVLASADEQTVRNAIRVINRLSPVAVCGELDDLRAGPRPPSPAIATDVDTLLSQVAEVRALNNAGRYEQATTIAERALLAANKLDYQPLLAEVLIALGLAREKAGRYDEAVDLISRGSWLAKGNQQDDVAARGEVDLVWIVGARKHDLDAGMRWSRHAEASIRRLDSPMDLERSLCTALGEVYTLHGKLDDAKKQFECTLAKAGESSFERGVAYANLGAVAVLRHQLDYALEHLERGRQEFERELGAKHPSHGFNLANVGFLWLGEGEYGKALDYFERSRAILEPALGADNPRLDQLLIGLGEAHRGLGQFDDAMVAYRRAHEIQLGPLGAHHPGTVAPLFHAAAMLLDENRVEEADAIVRELTVLLAGAKSEDATIAKLALVEGRVAIAREQYKVAIGSLVHGVELAERGNAGDVLVELRLEVARCERHLGHSERGLHALELAVEASVDLQERPELRGEARFALAQALQGTSPQGDVPTARSTHLRSPMGADDARTRELAMQAVTDYASAGGAFAKQRAEVEHWLRTLE